MFKTGEEVKSCVEGIIHEETQVAEIGIDLTVDEVMTPTSPTDLDFGGSEEKLGDLEPVAFEKRSPEDDYGWWNLKAGIYIIDFNEEVNAAEELGIISPLERMTSGGSFHAHLLFTGYLERKPVLYVSEPGLNIKENARISRLLLWR